MKDDFLNDDWLTEQLTEEPLSDDSFSYLTMQIIDEQHQPTPWYLYIFSTAIVCSLGYLVINLLLSIFTDTALEKPALINMQWSSLLNDIQVDPVSAAVMVLAFALIWSIEEFDLL